MLKRFSVGVLVTVTMFFLVGCSGGYGYDHKFILVYIHEEYNDKYLAGEFTLEDFNYKHATDLLHDYHFSEDRLIMIKLENSGYAHALNAVKYFSKSKYVEQARLCNYMYAWDWEAYKGEK